MSLELRSAELLHHVLKTAAQYRTALRANMYGMWRGTFGWLGFWERMSGTIELHFTRAWHEALRSVGLTPVDMTPEEQLELQSAILNERSHITKLANALEAGSKANGGKWGAFAYRIDLWVNRYDAIKAKALTMAKADAKLEWVLHASESCNDCLRLGGKVKRASVWRRNNLYPQVSRLDCMQGAGGVPVCKCQLVPTDKPVSRGRLPLVR